MGERRRKKKVERETGDEMERIKGRSVTAGTGKREQSGEGWGRGAGFISSLAISTSVATGEARVN